MKRVPEFWFEFKGIRNTNMNVLMMGMPVRAHPAERGEQLVVAGRSGYLWMPDGGYENTVVRILCMADGNFDIDAINAWLSGAGDLRFSDEPNRVYKARVTKEFSRSNKLARFTAQEFTPSFDCQPFRYKYLSSPAADDWVKTQSGATLTNPGTYPSEPKIKIEGSGDFVVYVGAQMMSFTGISGGIIVDSELMDCFDLAESALLNSKAALDEFPVLSPGANIITWSGPVTKITITPRWRYL